MSASQVQRKLEFPVKKRVTRRSKILSDKENDENSPAKIKQHLTSPRKRQGQAEVVTAQQHSPSPSKKQKENQSTPRRRGETPVRGSLATKFAAVKVKDKSRNTAENKPESLQVLPLSPRKQFDNATNIQIQSLSPKRVLQSPLQLGTDKSSPLKSSVKAISVKKVLAENSPVKRSPGIKLHKQDGKVYNQAKQSFHTAKPERLVGRDKEMSEIRKFLKNHMSAKRAGSLYISGAPGTGKTAVLSHIIDEMKGPHSCKTLYLNCMTLKDSVTVYGKLYTDLTGKNAPTAKERLRSVEKCLTSDGPAVIMVLDEIDQLDSKNQEILYTIFEWPSLPKSRLILVGIANALDLTDRILPRLQARPNCKPELLNFAPYTKEQISAIIKDRLKELEVEGMNVMDATAVQFCARKISAVAGDMRKALDVCRRAVEMVETDVRSQRTLKPTDSEHSSPKKSPEVPKKISVVHINKVLSDVYGSGTSASQQDTVPLQQKIVMCSLLLLLKQGKMKEVTVGKLHEIYSKVCKKRQMAAVDHSEFQGITSLLEARGMIGIKKAKETRLAKITLKLDEKELEHTMQDKVLISSILQDGIPK